MKFFAIAILAAGLSSAVMADPMASVNRVGAGTAAVSMSPAYTSGLSLVLCTQTPNLDACLAKMSLSYGLLSSSTTLLLKEDVKNVEVDGYDYLAGAPKTLALEEVIQRVRELETDSEEYSDEEIVSAMLKSI